MDDLIARFRAGDHDAVRVIYRQYGGAVMTVATSIVGDPGVAADVVQQTFMKAWRAAASFDASRELAPWLYSIARRTAIDAVRKDSRSRPADVDPNVLASDTISFERTWEIFEVRRAIDELPADEREVIRLSHLVGLPHGEISQRLEIPLGTVKSRSARALRRLKAALGHMADSANQTSSVDVKMDKE